MSRRVSDGHNDRRCAEAHQIAAVPLHFAAAQMQTVLVDEGACSTDGGAEWLPLEASGHNLGTNTRLISFVTDQSFGYFGNG